MLERATFEHKVSKFLTPILIVIIGLLAKNKLESIDNRMASIEVVLIEQGKLNLRLDRIEKEVDNIEVQLTHSNKYPAKIEKEITIDTLNNQL